MTDNLRKKTIDDTIFNIKDYVGGNIEGVDPVDRMGFTVFLREQLLALITQEKIEARLDEWIKLGKSAQRWPSLLFRNSNGFHKDLGYYIEQRIEELNNELKNE